jgi:hypothetical protein
MSRSVYPLICLTCLAIIAILYGLNRHAWWATAALVIALAVAVTSVGLWVCEPYRSRGSR